MAVLVACASANFLTSTTWEVVDATSYLNSETGSDTLTTAYSGTRSSAFTPGAITVDALLVKLANRTGTTGTISVSLRNSTIGLDDFVAGTEVTINCADLPAGVTADLDGGWILFKFASPVLLLAANAYNIQAKTSSSTQVLLFRDGTTDNISRCLRTTTTQAPTTGDDLIICGEKTGAGAETAITVTMNETAATDYGSNTTSLVTPALAICDGGTLTYNSASAGNPYLRLSGHAIGYRDGALNMGTVATPIPRDSVAVLEFDCAADGDMGLVKRNGFTFVAQGLSRTSGKNVVVCKLNTDEAAAQTTLGVDTDTGWLSGDEIVLASTTRTPGDTEKRVLSANANAADMTVTAGLTNAHSGTSPTQAEVINITRNVKIRSVSSSAMAYVWAGPGAVVDIDWVEFYYLGENVATKRGVEIATTTGTFNMQYSSVHDCEDGGVYSSAASGSGITVSNNVGYNLNTAAVISQVTITAGATLTFSNNVFLGGNTGTNLYGLVNSSATAVITNNTFAGVTGSGSGVTMFNIMLANSIVFTGTFSGNTAHSNSGNGVTASGTGCIAPISTFTAWRNTAAGILPGTSGGYLTFSSCVAFGNATAGLLAASGIVKLISCTFNAGVTLTQPIGIQPSTGTIFIFDSSFGATTGHSTGDISHLSGGTAIVYAFNSVFASSTEITALPTPLSAFKSHKHDASGSVFKSVYYAGTIQNDTTTRHTASGYSWKMTPSKSNIKLVLPGPNEFDTMTAAVVANKLVTLGIYVYKDSSYNGNNPRLVVVGGIVAGVGSAGTDVTDTLSVAHSNWELLEVTFTPTEDGVIEYYVDCDGTAGNAYVDDSPVAQAA